MPTQHTPLPNIIKFVSAFFLCSAVTTPVLSEDSYDSAELDDWPTSFKAEDTSIEVVEESSKENVFKYQSKNFIFELPGRVSRNEMRDVIEVFEGTYGALAVLPFGLENRTDSSRYKVRIFGSHDAFVKAGGYLYGVGRYMWKQKTLYLSPRAIGLAKKGPSYIFKDDINSLALISEISLQVLAPWDIPFWLRYGIAQYMKSVPYKNGTFSFRRVNWRNDVKALGSKIEKPGILYIEQLVARQSRDKIPAERFGGPARFAGRILALYFLEGGDEEAQQRLRDYFADIKRTKKRQKSADLILMSHSSGESLQERVTDMVRPMRITPKFYTLK